MPLNHGRAQSHIANLTDTRRLFLCPECGMLSLIKLQSGTTCELCQPETLWPELTSSPLDFRVRIFHLLAAARAWKESEAVYFSKLSDWLMNYDLVSFSWKMSQLSLHEDLEPSLDDFPSSGMTVAGRLFQPRSLEPVICDDDGSCLPTPMAAPCGSNRSMNSKNRRFGLSQLSAKGMIPTPLARDSKGMMGRAALERRNSPNLPDTIGGPLNPQFVEEIMGYDLDATALGVLETQWFQSKPGKRSKDLAV